MCVGQWSTTAHLFNTVLNFTSIFRNPPARVDLWRNQFGGCIFNLIRLVSRVF